MPTSRTPRPVPRWWWLLLATLLLAGGMLRGFGLNSRSLEYDEIWTLRSYAMAPVSGLDLLRDLRVPNNHPLHSLLVRGAIHLHDSPAMARLPAFLGGLTVLGLLPWLAWRLTRHRSVALLTLALAAGDGFLLHYSQTARGYSLQTALLLALVALAVLAESAWGRRHPGWLLPAMPLLAALALLTLPTSLLYLPLIGLFHLLWAARGVMVQTGGVPWEREPLAPFLATEHPAPPATEPLPCCRHPCGLRTLPGWFVRERPGRLLTWLGILAVGVIWWLFFTQGLREAKTTFSIPLHSLRDWTGFAWGVLTGLESLPILVLTALGLGICVRRQHPGLTLALCGWLLTPLAAAAVTGAGVARAYAPLVPAVLLAAAAGLDALIRMLAKPLGAKALPARQALLLAGVAGILLPAGAIPSRQTPPDWPEALYQAPPELVADAWVLSPPTRGFELLFADPSWPQRQSRALAATPPSGLILLSEKPTTLPGGLPPALGDSGVPAGATPAPLRLGALTAWRFQLVPAMTATAPDAAAWLACIGPLPLAERNIWGKRLPQTTPGQPWLLANPFWDSKGDGYDLWLTGVLSPGIAARLLELERHCEGRLRLFRVAAPGPPAAAR